MHDSAPAPQKHSPTAVRLGEDVLNRKGRFFRDKDAYAELAIVIIPELVENHPPDRQLKIWVPGCGTGEEVYSVAMLFLEERDRTNRPLDVKLFASDPDEHVVGFARNGVYPCTIESEIAPDRLNRFFTREGDFYRARRELREAVSFCAHNSLTNTPIGPVDMISCRNALRSARRGFRENTILRFHDALRTDGVLFLGDCGPTPILDELFEPSSRTYQVYWRIGGATPRAPWLVSPGDMRSIRRRPGSKKEQASRECELARHLLLDVYAPPSVLIDRNSECIGFFGSIQRYLDIEGADANPPLFAITREGVRDKLKAALRPIWPQADVGRIVHAGLEQSDRFALLDIAVFPIQAEGESLLLVSFLDTETYLDRQPAAPAPPGGCTGPMKAMALPEPRPQTRGGAAGTLACLSPRQRAVLDLVAGGRSNKQIAVDLGISERTVECHRAIVMRKLGARSFADLIRRFAAA